jgi:hypothetical protein
MAEDQRRQPLIRLGKRSWPTSTLISYRYKQFRAIIKAIVAPPFEALKIAQPVEMGQVISSAEDLEIFSMPIKTKGAVVLECLSCSSLIDLKRTYNTKFLKILSGNRGV